MNIPTSKNFWKNIIVQVGAVSAVIAIGLLMYSLQQGSLHSAALRLKQFADVFSSITPIEVDLIPMPYDVPVCTPGAAPQDVIIILSRPDTAVVYLSGTNGTAMSAPLNKAFYLPKGTYKIIAQSKAGFAWSQRSVFSFTIDKVCDNMAVTISGGVMTTPTTQSDASTTTGGVLEGVASGMQSAAGDASTTTITATTTTIGPAATTTYTVPPLPIPSVSDTTFTLGKNYPTDWSVTPMIFKDNVRVYSGVGQVLLQAEVPSDRVVMLFGSDTGWTTGGVFGTDRGLSKISGTQRWVLPFDTRKYPDGNYHIAAAYFTNDSGWKFTGSVDFRIANTVIVPAPVLAPTPTITPNVATLATTSGEQYVPTWKPPVDESTAPLTSAAAFTPTLRLVVDDHQVTTLGRVFDREQLEVRATTLPAQSVIFLAYALDGGFKPAIKELGKGGRDDLLSREGKEVWTYTIDMSSFPSGNYRLFARVRTMNNLVLETAPSSVAVQHLNQLSVTANPPLASSDLPPATATREQILQRVQDPSSCQNRQECEVFCSSSNASADKCADFARVQGISGYNTDTIQSDVVKLQSEIKAQFSVNLPQYIARAAFTGTTTEAVASSSAPAVNASSTATDWKYADSVGRPSLADVLPVSVLDATVANPVKLAAELPADVHTPSDFQSYCGAVEHAERCTKIITNIAPDLAPALKKQEEIVQRVEQHAVQVIEQRTGARIFTDTDGDGISDYDEINIFHTDPNKRDTFGSGYSDGAALLSQASDGPVATGTATSSHIILASGLAVENPKITGTTQTNIMNVASVGVLEVKDTVDGKKDVAKALFKGKALPNSFVKIYLFSDPIVVTVKTDDQGNWSYILDKTLPDGAHSAYVAMVDNGGRILAKSAPLPFVKEASALTVEAAGPEIGAPTKTGMFSGLTPLALIALVVGILGLGLSVIGAVIGIKHSAGQGGNNGLSAS